MDRQQQIDLLKRLLHYLDSRSTALAEAPWRNDVAVYSDPAALGARAAHGPVPATSAADGLCLGVADAGRFRTDDYAGVPMLIVRGRDGKLRAFLNVCRHRGAKVAQGCGKARVFCVSLSCLDL